MNDQSSINVKAFNLLDRILETQPNLLTEKTGTQGGKRVAEFCASFIETYSEWLEKNGKYMK